MTQIKLLIKIIIGLTFRTYCRCFSPFRNKTIILMYHRVIKNPNNLIYDSAMYVTPNTLEMHIRELKNYFEFIPMDSLTDHSKIGKARCIVTFDDGWKDNYQHAFPLLKKNKIPASIFLTINLIGKRDHFWFHKVALLLNTAISNSMQNEFAIYMSEKLGLKHVSFLNEDYLIEISAALKNKTPDAIESFIDNASKDMNLTLDSESELLNWNEISEMSGSGISFGSHTMNHAILTKVDDRALHNEIFESYKLLKERNINFSNYFCYPNGNYNSKVIGVVEQAGHSGAITAELGVNDRETNRFSLKRVGLHEDVSRKPSLLWYRLFQSLKTIQ